MPTTRGASIHGASSPSASRKTCTNNSAWWVPHCRSRGVKNDTVRRLFARRFCIVDVFGVVIRIPLKRETTSVGVQARQRAALGIWDRVRAAQGLSRWHVAYVGALRSLHILSPSLSMRWYRRSIYICLHVGVCGRPRGVRSDGGDRARATRRRRVRPPRRLPRPVHHRNLGRPSGPPRSAL